MASELHANGLGVVGVKSTIDLNRSTCPYADNDFCASLSNDASAELCAVCRFKRYPAGSVFDCLYFAKSCACILDGVIADGILNAETGRFRAQMICTPGKLVGANFLDLSAPNKLNESHAITDVVVALFDQETCLRLYESDVSFLHALLNDYSVGWHNLESLACEDSAVEKVRYYLMTVKKMGFPSGNQSIIADACGLSRQSVIKAMAELTKDAPELFS